MSDEGEEYGDDDRYVSDLPGDTAAAWRHMKRLCERRAPMGFGPLDSFLSGPDLDRRMELVEKEAPRNEWLRLELRDTLGLNQSTAWTPEQIERMRRAAFIDAGPGGITPAARTD